MRIEGIDVKEKLFMFVVVEFQPLNGRVHRLSHEAVALETA